MSTSEIIRLARAMVREVRNGAARAAHWLAALKWDITVVLAIIRGAR